MRRQAIAIMCLAVGLGYSCASSDAPANAPARTRAGRRGPASPPVQADLDLRAMLPPVPEYEGQGRNLFGYGPVRSTPPPEARPTTTTIPGTQVRATTTISRTAPTRVGTRLRVQYAGFVEKTEVSGDKSKYAIFLDGNEIFAGAEGETIANRFTVVEIGLESVTVSAEGSIATQRIPLQAN